MQILKMQELHNLEETVDCNFQHLFSCSILYKYTREYMFVNTLVHVRDINKTQESQVSIFFLNPGKGIFRLLRIETDATARQ